MLDELQLRNDSQTTVKAYLSTVEAFAKHFHRPPDQLGPDEIRSYQVLFAAGEETGCPHRRSSHSSFAVLLLQNAEAKLSGRGGPVPEQTATATDRLLTTALAAEPLPRHVVCITMPCGSYVFHLQSPGST